MKSIIAVILASQWVILFSQINTETLKYFIPENTVQEIHVGKDGFKTITYWVDSISMKNSANFPIGIDVYNEIGVLIHYERRFNLIFYAISYRLDGKPSLVNISTEQIATLIYYHSNGKISYIGTFDIQGSLEEKNETGVHCEFDETGKLISYKLYDKGVLLNEIKYE